MANALEAFGEATLDPTTQMGLATSPFNPVKTTDVAVGGTSGDLGPVHDSAREFPELGEGDSGRGGTQAGAAPNPELFPRLTGPAGPIAPGVDRRVAPALAPPTPPEETTSTGFAPSGGMPADNPQAVTGGNTLPPNLLRPLLAIVSARQRALG